jgi:hypothetical protein
MQGMAVLLMVLTILSLARPPIRWVPKIVDHQFTTRFDICPTSPRSVGTFEDNEARRSVAELFGPELIELHVHQVGDSLRNFTKVASHIRHLLAQRPRFVSRFPPWAEATPMEADGILGTLRYTRGRTGRFEIAGIHLCAEDSSGKASWIRLAPGDRWP